MALFGSKPLVDLDTVTGPVQTPVINQPGLGGYFGRVLDPSTNNSPLGRALGMFGQNLMAQQPGLGGDIGRAMVGVRDEDERSRGSLLQRQLMQARIDDLRREPEARTPEWMQQLIAAGYQPGTPDFQTALKTRIGLGPQQQKPAPTRERMSGNTVIQEEMQPDGTWRQIGSGPRWSPNGGVNVNVGFKGPVPQVSTAAELDALPKGSPFLAPDGSMRIKP